MRPRQFNFLTVASACLFATSLPAGDPVPRQLRILGPDILQRGGRNLVYAEGLFDAKTWKPLAPDKFTGKGELKVWDATRWTKKPVRK